VITRRSALVPIVMGWSNDPVGNGLVASLAKPGGSVTGLAWHTGVEIGGKRLELLKQVSPGLSRVTNLWDPGDAALARYWPEVRRAAEALGMTADLAEVRRPEELQKALSDAKQRRAALFVWWLCTERG
jgi:putative ABC transport system substrate-binding protein